MSSRSRRHPSAPALSVLLAVVLAAGAGSTGIRAATTPTPESSASTGPLEPIAEHVPSTTDRYDLAGGCFALFSPASDGYVRRVGAGFAADGTDAAAAEPFRFQAFDLGKYLVMGTDGAVLAAEGGPAEALDGAVDDGTEGAPTSPGADGPRTFVDDAPSAPIPDPVPPSTRSGAVTAAAAPSALAEWIVRDAAGGSAGDFLLHLPVDDRAEDDPGPSDVDGTAPVAATLAATPDGTLHVVDGTEPAAVFEVHDAPAGATCAEWPEVEINVKDHAPTGDNPVDEVAGYLDAHMHMMAFEFIGGRSRCGRPWHPYGPAYALVDCPDHEPGGAGALLEMALGGPPTHATAGWPDFPYWPRYDSLTHEQAYYRWLERAWRGGLRMFTNLLVDNNALCEAWPYKERSCNEMDGVRLQAQRLRELERYVDAQWGGPGEGWFRIVTDPFGARRTINEGRLAVVMGIEVSVLFDCGLLHGQPLCDTDDIDRELAAVYDVGVRQMELANKFDNALTGVTGDAGETGIVVNTGNFFDTGQFWQMETCPEDADPHQHDRHQHNINDSSGGATGPFLERDGIFGAVLQVTGTSGAAPLYPEGPHCNVRGLTDLGRYLLDGMVERGMLFDPDHMSSRGRQDALDHLQAQGYSGVVSSHSWADDSVYERVLEMGGVVTPYAGDATSFADQWRTTRGWADDRYLFGIGYGADTNGFGSQGAPRNPAAGPGVSYPFTGFGGVTVHRQKSGSQIYDINTDGVDHYGLYPDWIEDIRVLLGSEGPAFVSEILRGPEAYLQTWERAAGIANDACRDSRVAAPTDADVAAIDVGTPAADVLMALGQPSSRAGGVYTYCTQEGTATVTFDSEGRVASVA